VKEHDDLDPLLEGPGAHASHDPADAPPDLAERVLARLRPELTELRLDRLLDCLEVDEPPPGLAGRVLLRSGRELGAARRAVRPTASVGRRLLLVAAGLVAVLILALRFLGGTEERAPARVAEADPELLESLDLLENWEILTDDELDLVFAELDDVDLTLFEAANELEIEWDDVSWEEG